MNATRCVLYGLGQVGMMSLARFFFTWSIAFAAQEQAGAVLFSAAAVGAVLFGFRLFDGVTDPLAGLLSDGWVRRGRERRGLLWLTFWIPPIGLALVFAPSFDMSTALRWALLVAGMFVFFVGYTVYAIPYWSLLADYSGEDVRARRVLSNVLGAGLLVATALVAVVSPQLIAPLGYFGAAVAFGVPAALLMLAPWAAQPPGRGPPKPDPAAPPMLASLKLALTHRRFLAVLLIYSGSQMSFTVVTLGAPFMVTKLLGGVEADLTKIMLPFLGTSIPFFVAVPWISRRLGWERATVVASVALAVAYGSTFRLGATLPFMPELLSPMGTAMLIFSLAGPMSAVLLGVEGEAVAECAREQPGEAVSIYFGVLNLVVKAMNGVATLLTGVLVSQGQYRLLGPVAGGLLVLGVVGYALARPRSGSQPGAAAGGPAPPTGS